MLPHWPVFNVADMAINAGAIVILVLAFRGIHLDGTREPRTGETDADDASQEPTT